MMKTKVVEFEVKVDGKPWPANVRVRRRDLRPYGSTNAILLAIGRVIRVSDLTRIEWRLA